MVMKLTFESKPTVMREGALLENLWEPPSRLCLKDLVCQTGKRRDRLTVGREGRQNCNSIIVGCDS